MTPTLTVSQSAWNTATAKSVAITWGAGDLILVLGMESNNTTGDNISTPTATGLTFTAIDTDTTQSTGAHCYAASWKATAASSGSASVQTSAISTGDPYGIMVVVVTAGTYSSVGSHTRVNNTAETVSLAVAGPSSAIIELIGDWGAGATTGYSFTPSGATTQVALLPGVGTYTVYGATWTNQAASTTNYGVSVTSSGAQYTKLIVEVEGITLINITTAWLMAGAVIAFLENFEGGTNGTALSTSNTSFTQILGTGTSVFDSSLAVNGTLSAKLTSSGSVGDYRQMRYIFASDESAVFCRLALHLTALPTGNFFCAQFVNYNVNAELRINTAGKVSLMNNNLAVATSTSIVPLNTWFVLEWGAETTSSSQTARIYSGTTGTPAETITGTYDQGAMTQFMPGITATLAITVWFDAIAASYSGWIGTP